MRGTLDQSAYRIRRVLIALLFFGFALTGCGKLGPKILEEGRNDYNQAVNITDVQEFLLNVVRLRFNDRPYLLGISSITSRNELTTGFDAAIRRQDRTSSGQRRGEGNKNEFREGAVGGELQYRERPSVFYSPLRGSDFVDQLLTPVSLNTLFLLRLSGWELDKILRVFARRVNDVPNAPTAGRSRLKGVPQYKEFLRANDALGELEARGAILVALSNVEQRGEILISVLPEARNLKAFETFTRIFQLDPTAEQYRIKIGWRPTNDREIVVETRPMIGAMYYVSKGIEVPLPLVNAGTVEVSLDKDYRLFDWSELHEGLVKIYSSTVEPVDAYIAVRYRGYWYFIDDKDESTKETMTMLQVVLTLKGGDQTTDDPVLTLSVD